MHQYNWTILIILQQTIEYFVESYKRDNCLLLWLYSLIACIIIVLHDIQNSLCVTNAFFRSCDVTMSGPCSTLS